MDAHEREESAAIAVRPQGLARCGKMALSTTRKGRTFRDSRR